MNPLSQRALPIAVLLCTLATAGLQSGQQANRKPEQKSASSQTNARVNAIRENNFGVALMNRQMFEKALEKFRSVCADEAQAGLGCLNAGIALLNLQRQQDARVELLAYANKHPESPRVWYNLGLLERAEGNLDSAIKDFQTTARLDPRDADTRYFIGLLELQSQHYDLAIAGFESALQLNPFHASAEFGLAQASEHAGLTEQAREHLLRFQHITSTKLGAPIGSAYGEEGNYSLAEEMAPAPEPVPPAIPVHFVDVTSISGFPKSASASIPSRSLAGFLGSGACVFDYDGDGLQDVLLVNSDGNGDPALYRNLGNRRFEDVTRKAKISFHGEGTACAVGDYDNDGHPDFAIGSSQGVVLFHNQGDGTFRDVTDTVGIHTKGLVLGLAFIDFDHDGDLDLYVDRVGDSLPWNPQDPLSLPRNVTPAGNVLWRNNGNSTFTDWTQATGLGGGAPSVSAIGSDVNNDRATDFVLTGWADAPTVFLNQREGPFQPVIPWATAMPGPTAGAVALDFDKDDWMDLAFTHWSTPGLSLWRNVGGKSFERVPLPDLGWRRGWGVAALDYDNDGWVDLVAVGEDSSGAGRIALLRNEGALGFRDVTHETDLDKVVLRNPRGVIPFDYDQDGTADLLITQKGLSPVLLRNFGGNKNHWLKIALKGTIDNKSSIGTKVQVFAGPLRQKWEVGGASGYLGQGPAQILAGLGIETSADVVRLLWPTGVVQDELEIPAQQPRLITEIERRGSSCPILFVWNGKRFQFLADIIGPGIVGHWVGPTERNIPNPEEYLKVPRSQVAAKNGLIQFKLLEPMEELDYLDRVRLLAIDHPADIEVYPNEYFASKPPFPKFKVIASRNARPPQGAWDDSGRDVLPLLLQRDRQYVTNFRLAPYAGFAMLHSLTLDLGMWNPHRPLRLLMDGFTDYFSANSMYAAWKAGVQPVPPYVEALDSSHKWVHILGDMGFPAGLARTMVADLTGRVPPGTRLIRITTNLRIYWDRIRVDNSPEDLPYVVMEAPLVEARLAFRGYPRVIEGNPKNDIRYVYEDVSVTGPYARQIGNYTRYGEVTDLVRSSDEEYVIFGSGDEVAVDFDARHVPALPSGWLRDYLFYADGFAKDMDFYAAFGDTVSPLPFHTSIPFPYPDGIGYPADDQHLKYLLEYNTRGVLGPAGPSFHFTYSDARR